MEKQQPSFLCAKAEPTAIIPEYLSLVSGGFNPLDIL
jgi:hypothetical protein